MRGLGDSESCSLRSISSEVAGHGRSQIRFFGTGQSPDGSREKKNLKN